MNGRENLGMGNWQFHFVPGHTYMLTYIRVYVST